MKTLGFFTFFVAITSSGLAQTTPLPTPTAQPVTPYEEMVNAKPILINGLEFVASTQAQWQAWDPPFGKDAVEVQLLITNRSKGDLIFSVFDTFQVVIKGADGKVIICGGGRDHTLRTKPVLIRAGDTYCLSRSAMLSWLDEHNREFVYEDGTGSWFSWDKLVAGKYSLSFRVGSKGNDEGMAFLVQHHGFSGEIASQWAGEGETPAVPFEIVDPPGE